MSFEPLISHCNQCGASTLYITPSGEGLPRHMCSRCQHIQYLNPKLICGCLALWEDKILLCKRSIEPRSGFWTIPAGFMEMRETLEEAAKRETLEEAGAIAQQLQLYRIINLPTIGQIHVLFSAHVENGVAEAGLESEEVAWFTPENIPWEALAFRTVELTLKDYIDDQKSGQPLSFCVKTLL